jgi:hypothetical protein
LKRGGNAGGGILLKESGGDIKQITGRMGRMFYNSTRYFFLYFPNQMFALSQVAFSAVHNLVKSIKDFPA